MPKPLALFLSALLLALTTHAQASSVEAAEAAIHEREAGLRRVIDGMIPAGAWLDEAALYRENLISGIVRDADPAA